MPGHAESQRQQLVCHSRHLEYGMGEVWCATDTNHGRQVAFKIPSVISEEATD
jgi:hypothetical protein